MRTRTSVTRPTSIRPNSSTEPVTVYLPIRSSQKNLSFPVTCLVGKLQRPPDLLGQQTHVGTRDGTFVSVNNGSLGPDIDPDGVTVPSKPEPLLQGTPFVRLDGWTVLEGLGLGSETLKEQRVGTSDTTVVVWLEVKKEVWHPRNPVSGSTAVESYPGPWPVQYKKGT